MGSRVWDTRKADAFAQRMVGILNEGALALMVSIGHRTGLFDTLASLPPSTSPQIAGAAGLNERYVREWLGAMVTGRIIDIDPEDNTYSLPTEHAASLTRAATPNNIAMFAQYIPLLGVVEDDIVDCFRNGGGVPYSSFPRFQLVMAEESSQTVASALLDAILPLAPGLVDSLRSGIDILDVGCGRGHAVNVMAQAFPNSRFTGFDLSKEGIAAARKEAGELGLSNADFRVEDISALNSVEQYDLITAFDVIHDQAKPGTVLSEISKALRSGGTFLMQDIRASSHVEKNLDHPMGTFLYTISCMHCMTVSLALGGAGLGAVWGEELALQMLGEAGFTNVDVHQLPHDVMNNYYVATKD